MAQAKSDANLPESRRKEIFLALVDAQDHDMSVTQSRKLICDRFTVSDMQLRKIEHEGIELQWPPLGDIVQ